MAAPDYPHRSRFDAVATPDNLALMPDAIVIGAGPNGLVAANVLADAGWGVLVLEANDEVGGAVRSGELVEAGFTSDLFSAFYPLAVASRAVTGLRLEEHGLRWRRSALAFAHPTPGGGHAAVATGDVDATAASCEAYAAGDGDAWRAVYGRWERVGDGLLDALLTPFPPLRAAARLAVRLGPSGVLPFLRFGLLPVRRAGEEEFAGAGGPLLLAGNTLHADFMPESTGGALFGWLLTCLAQQVGFPVPEGGAGQLSRAMARRLEARGGRIERGTSVERVVIRGRRAAAVRTADELPAGRAVLADVSAPRLFLDLVGEEHLPAGLLAGLRRFEWDSGTVKVDWTLDGPIPWEAEPVGEAGTVHVGRDMDELSRHGLALAIGELPERPFLVLGQYRAIDPSRAPEGKEVAWAYTHVPQRVRNDAAGEGLTGAWDEQESARFADRMEAQVERFAPGFRDRIRARHVFDPPKLQTADANLAGGALNGGTAQLHQQLVFRPTSGLGRPETPIGGLYLASASAHPGGGVHGACGANAARAAMAAAPGLRRALAARLAR
jgi:phytoene dehydrogenase-like protein